MKKIVFIIVAVAGIGGLIALLQYHPQTGANNSVGGGGVGVATGNATTPTPGAVPAGLAYRDGTYTGSTVDVGYGPVQVQAVVAGGKITAVNFLQMPFDRQQSAEIASQAKPLLLSEALQAQTANVDTVSGATADSEGFVQSLTAALGQAKS